MIEYKNPREIQKMREAARVVAECHERMKEWVRPGISTLELDQRADQHIRARGGLPSFLGYRGFPASICTSVNSAVVHGIPNAVPLCEGDILSIDIGVYKGGFHGDAARTYPVGEISAELQKLLAVTEQALLKAVEQVVVGHTLADIAGVIEATAKEHGYGIVREFVGHGIGRNLHEDPQLPNYVTKALYNITCSPGLVLAIEPMFNLGTDEVRILEDQWTVVTADGKASAHFEHDVAVTNDGPCLLTVI